MENLELLKKYWIISNSCMEISNQDLEKKTIYELLQSITTDCNVMDELGYFLRDLNLDDVTDGEDLIERIEEYYNDNNLLDVEIIYYSNALKYLQENDQSLATSLWIAKDFGYNIDWINSELLASLLATENNKEAFGNWLSEAKALLSDYEFQK